MAPVAPSWNDCRSRGLMPRRQISDDLRRVFREIERQEGRIWIFPGHKAFQLCRDAVDRQNDLAIDAGVRNALTDHGADFGKIAHHDPVGLTLHLDRSMTTDTQSDKRPAVHIRRRCANDPNYDRAKIVDLAGDFSGTVPDFRRTPPGFDRLA